MIHRALFGSVERFMAVLIEHYAGALPTWLSPEQVRVLPVTDEQGSYGQSVVDACAAAGLRATLDTSGEKLGALVRRAKLAKLPYVLVVGPDDVREGTVGVNRRGSTDNKPSVGWAWRHSCPRSSKRWLGVARPRTPRAGSRPREPGNTLGRLAA